MVERRLEISSVAPAWLALPSDARILTSEGLDMRPLRNSGVSYENARLGLLVGALRNEGGCAADLTVRLQYTDDRWAPLGDPIENEARVSQADPQGLVPYRFRLRRNDEFATPPSGYIIQVSEQRKPIAAPLQWVSTAGKKEEERKPCAPKSVDIRAASGKGRTTLKGFRISGTLTLQHGGPIRPDAVMVTAVLLDQEGQVLEVLTGVPDLGDGQVAPAELATGQSVPFTLTTPIPVGQSVATTQLFPEVLPDAQVGPPQR